MPGTSQAEAQGRARFPRKPFFHFAFTRRIGDSRISLGGIIALAALTSAIGARGAGAVAGDLDPSFGTGGKVTFDFGTTTNRAFAVAMQPDEKVVVVGSAGSFDYAIARLLPNGGLDPSFGDGGKVRAHPGEGFDEAFAVVIQADEKVVVAGAAGCGDFGIVRYLPDGRLDPEFGGGGVVTTDFGACDQAFAMALQRDGKIIAAGMTMSPFVRDLALARYLPNGELDPTFGNGGRITTDFGGDDRAIAIAIDGDGRIVVAGAGGPFGDFALARYLADGSLDPAFGEGGLVLTDFGSYDAAEGLAIQEDGGIVAAGPGNGRFGFARYLPDGSLDPTFGQGGKTTILFAGDNSEAAHDVALQADGKIVAAGFAFRNFGSYFAIARLDRNGVLDPRFGNGGLVMTSFTGEQDNAVADGIAIQSDGKIIAAGGAGGCTPPCSFALARYEPGSAAIEVSIDIRPGADGNPIPPSGRGVVRVAVLSSDEFDATSVDPGTVCFGDADDPARRNCTARRPTQRTDVNEDGLTDLVLQFDFVQAGVDAADTMACLTGRTFEGTEIQGCDAAQTARRRGIPMGGRLTADLKLDGAPDRDLANEVMASSPRLALLRLAPNPVRLGAECRVRFAVTADVPARLDVLDARGRLILTHAITAGEIAPQEVGFRLQGPIAPGVYWLRLSQGGGAESRSLLLLP